jgi:aerobic-type carbon monoxide dehydrogenase small subunit (CoxS/CutS family)
VIGFRLNGAAVDVDAPAEMPLLWVLRDKLGLTGTKYGCGIAQCGACTVQLDGVAVRSCAVPVSAAAGREVRTVEALASATGLAAVQQAWIDEQVPQCGYCQSGMLMTVDALLSQNPDPDDATIDSVVTNICRCGTYPRIRRAIHRAARMRRNSA